MARIRSFILVVTTAALVAACGSAPATPVPVAQTTPTPTPNPHLSPPVSVDLLYNKLKKAGLTIYVNAADAGRDGEPRKRLNLSYEGWPLSIAEYSSARALVRESGFDAAKRPGVDDPPYTIVGMNILVQYGPQLATQPPKLPDERWVEAARKLSALLDPLLGPLEQSSTAPLPLPTATPAPTVQPTATPTPTVTPKRTPKPSKKP